MQFIIILNIIANKAIGARLRGCQMTYRNLFTISFRFWSLNNGDKIWTIVKNLSYLYEYSTLMTFCEIKRNFLFTIRSLGFHSNSVRQFYFCIVIVTLACTSFLACVYPGSVSVCVCVCACVCLRMWVDISSYLRLPELNTLKYKLSDNKRPPTDKICLLAIEGETCDLYLNDCSNTMRETFIFWLSNG